MNSHGYLVVRNFERFQHYKNRNPPWIKLHAALLDDYEFGRLQDASKMHLIGIWILASKTDNRVPADPEWIARRIGAREAVDIEALVAAGLIERRKDASELLALPEQNAPPVEERREEVEERKEEEEGSSLPKQNGKLPHLLLALSADEQAVVDHYKHCHPKRLRGDLPSKTLRLLRKALKNYSVDDLNQAIDHNAASTFHREHNFMGLELILRDTEKIDFFLGLTNGGKPAVVGSDLTDETIQYID